MKKVISIATAITIAIIVSVASMIPAYADTVYTLDAVVVAYKLESDCYKLSCLDEQGELWEFYDEEPWHIGDIAILRLFAFDDDYTHDEILDAERCGTLELHELIQYIHSVTNK